MNYRGMTALVTGGSAGLGEAFARQLAAQGANLVLVARSEDKLNSLADTLRQQARVEVTVLRADLSSAESVDQLLTEVRNRGIRVELLVNNAGIGLFENFIDTPLPPQMDQINVNVLALVRLTHALLSGMIAARKDGVINIASNAAFQPLAGADIYAASKAFVLFFSEALALELENTGVHILTACPGPIATQFFANMNPKLQAREMDQPAPIVSEILHAFDKGKRVVIPGRLLVRLGTLGARLLPRNVILRLAASSVRQLNQKTREL